METFVTPPPFGHPLREDFASNNLSAIIRGFKGAVTSKINQKTNSNNTIWQSRFYDRIIRNDEELNNIRQYIIDNTLKWSKDRNNPENR